MNRTFFHCSSGSCFAFKLRGHGAGIKNQTLLRRFGGDLLLSSYPLILKNPADVGRGEASNELVFITLCFTQTYLFKIQPYTHIRARGRVLDRAIELAV